MFTITSPSTKLHSDSKTIRHILKEFPDQCIDLNSKGGFNIEIEVPMDGMRAFDHLGIVTMAAKSYVPLNEFCYELKGITRGSDAYTTTEVESYNYLFAPYLESKQHTFMQFAHSSSLHHACIQFFPVQCTVNIEFTAAFHCYDYVEVPYGPAPTRSLTDQYMITETASYKMARLENIARQKEDMKESFNL